MQYHDVIAAFEPSPEGAVAQPTVDASPARRLRDALEPIAMHSVWSQGTNERLAALGHDFMTGYVSSRAGLLGEPTAGVVVSAFAVFEPTMLQAAFRAGQQVAERDEVMRARDEATIESLTQLITDAEARRSTNTLEEALKKADGTARPLFCGVRDLPRPESAVGRLWRCAEMFREHRGDSHNAVCVAEGLDAVEMNILTELWVGMALGTYSASRGWDEAQLVGAASRLRARGLIDDDALSEAGTIFRAGLEARTDDLQEPILEAIGNDLDDLIIDLEDWSSRCLEAGAFPPDVYKRAAG